MPEKNFRHYVFQLSYLKKSVINISEYKSICECDLYCFAILFCNLGKHINITSTNNTFFYGFSIRD